MESYVYFIKSSDGLVKIGKSNNPEKRLSSLQTASPYNLEIIHKIEGSEKLEKYLHKLFEPFHIKGEWFEFSEVIKEFIAFDFSPNNYIDEEIPFEDPDNIFEGIPLPDKMIDWIRRKIPKNNANYELILGVTRHKDHGVMGNKMVLIYGNAFFRNYDHFDDDMQVNLENDAYIANGRPNMQKQYEGIKAQSLRLEAENKSKKKSLGDFFD